MATYLYLSNDPSDLSGYLKAYINTKSPNASTTVSTAVTNTADVTTTTVTMTLTAGGSQAKWITAPLEEAVTISGLPSYNIWAKESNATANAMVAVSLCQYTTTLQSAFTTSSTGAELTTGVLRVVWTTTLGATTNKEIVTSTAFSAGDRLAITPVLGPVGVMAAGGGFTVTMDYNGLTGGADGDTYIVLNESLRAGQAQVGSGDNVGITGKGVSYFYDLATAVQNGLNEGLYGTNASAQEIIDEANNQADLS